MKENRKGLHFLVFYHHISTSFQANLRSGCELPGLFILPILPTCLWNGLADELCERGLLPTPPSTLASHLGFLKQQKWNYWRKAIAIDNSFIWPATYAQSVYLNIDSLSALLLGRENYMLVEVKSERICMTVRECVVCVVYIVYIVYIHYQKLQEEL